MANCKVQMPEEFLQKLSRLGDKTDEICERVLEAGGEVVVEKVKSNLAVAIGRDVKKKKRATGKLLGALGLSPAKLGRDGNHNIKVGFAESRSDGVSNAKLASIIEYGKHGQSAKPFLKPAKSASKAACVDTMKAKLQEEVDGI